MAVGRVSPIGHAEFYRTVRCFDGSLAHGSVGGGNFAAEALLERGSVEVGLGAWEELMGIGVGIEVDGDFGVSDGVVDAVFEGVAEGLEEVEGAFVAGGIAVVADNGEDSAMGAETGDGDEVSEAGSELVGTIAKNDVVDLGGVEVAEGVSEVGVGEGSLRDVVAGIGVVGALEDGDGGVVVFGEVADDFAVAATAIVSVAEVVEGVGAGRAVCVGRSVDVDIHAAGEDGEVVLRGRREALRKRGGEDEDGECEDAEGVRQALGSFSRLYDGRCGEDEGGAGTLRG